MDSLTIPTSLIIPSASHAELTPAMVSVLWSIAHEVDRLRLPSNYGDAKWLEIPTKALRNPEGRADNVWLRQCFKRLMGMELNGEYEGDLWGAVMIAQWEIIEGGTLARVLIPPAAISALQAPKTFAKIEMAAAYRLKGHARRLYVALADKKRLEKNHWVYALDELQSLFSLGGKYQKWYDFSRYVLKPAIEEINDFGTVDVTATPQKHGRSVRSVRFEWKWKDIRAAETTEAENQKHSGSRRKKQIANDAPPLSDEAQQKALEWEKLTPEEQQAAIKRAHRLQEAHGFWPSSVPEEHNTKNPAQGGASG